MLNQGLQKSRSSFSASDGLLNSTETRNIAHLQRQLSAVIGLIQEPLSRLIPSANNDSPERAEQSILDLLAALDRLAA
jgi:hypothetical protein